MTTAAPVRAAYVHVPYCQTICGYCDFYSELLDRSATGRLVDALLTELNGWVARTPVSLRTIFVGGGTPTTLPPDELRRLLSRLRELADPDCDLEFTVEANPATVTSETAAALAESGVNRVSVGAQSFQPGELRVLDRIHRPEQVPQTLETLRTAGIGNLNLDLIFAVPGQTLDAWRTNLEAALALRPEHLSCYGLTYERGTPLFDRWQAGAVARADAELEAQMFELTGDVLAAAGFEHYEISNYSRPGRACRHNLVYWNNEASLGVGPSASGLVDGVRYRNIPDTAEYARVIAAGGSPRIQEEKLLPDARARETAMLQLRLIRGIDCAVFGERFGIDPLVLFREAIDKHTGLGLLAAGEGRIALTPAGLLLADAVIADFL